MPNLMLPLLHRQGPIEPKRDVPLLISNLLPTLNNNENTKLAKRNQFIYLRHTVEIFLSIFCNFNNFKHMTKLTRHVPIPKFGILVPSENVKNFSTAIFMLKLVQKLLETNQKAGGIAECVND